MVELYESKISQTDDLVDIADFLTEDPQYKKSVQKYINNPFDADIERVGKGTFTVAISKADSPSLDKFDPATAVTKATTEALAKLACTGARFLTTKNVDDRRITALGLIKDKKKITSMSFDAKGDTIYLVGLAAEENDFQMNNRTFDVILKAIERDYVTSAHYISSNGLFISLLECCAPNELGFDITGDAEVEDKEFLFGRSRYLAIVTVNDAQENDFVDFLFNEDIPVTLLGHVTKGELRLDDESFGFIEDYIQE
jgi:phosphoribosylformylglycinamidine (FGAM) synthase-like enzyme